MLYLIRSYGPRNRSILKVGFTDDIEARKNQYFFHNPLFQVISVREGDLILEGLIHRYLYFLDLQYKHGERLREWFDNDSEVLRVFHLSRETLERLVWRNRNKIFNIESFSPSDYCIFEYLYNKHTNEFRKRICRLKGIDQIFWRRYVKIRCEDLFADMDGITDPSAKEFLNTYFSTNSFQKRMKAFCEFMDNQEDIDIKDALLEKIDPRFNRLYSLLGSDRLKARNYRENRCETCYQNEVNNQNKISKLKEVIRKTFIIGKRYTNSDAKEMLRKIYDDLGYKKSPKATDLGEWFNIKRVYFNDSNGFELIGLK